MANQHYASVPAVGNTIVADIAKMAEMHGFHKDAFEQICSGWSDSSVASLAVKFTPAGVGATETTLTDKLKEIISVKDFGAVGDGDGAGGGTDDSTAIIAALTAVEVLGANAKLVFPNGIYLCDAILGNYTFSDVEIDFQGATLDFSNVADDASAYLLELTGSYAATAVELSSNAAVSQKTIACVSTTFAAGDFVKVYAETLWDASDTSTKIGELNFVETVPGGTSVTVINDLESTYNTADTAKIHKLTPIRNVTVKGGTFLGPAANDLLVGLYVAAGINVKVDGMTFKDVDAKGIILNDCMFSKVTNCHFEQANHASQAYGISFQNACQDCSAIGNSFVDVRHSLSTNNTVSSSWGIVRRILFMGNIVSDSAKATGGSGGDAIDTHAGAEEISIVNNIVNGSSNKGINVEASSCLISGNIITNCQSNGIHWENTSDQTGSATIIGNRIYNINLDAGSGQYGITCVTKYANCTSVTISNNLVIAGSTPIRLTWTSSCEFDRAIITGNIIRHSAVPTALSAITAEYVLSGVISNNVISANARCMVLDHCDHISIMGNAGDLTSQATEATAYGIYLTNCSYCSVVGNTLEDDTDATATTGVLFADTTTYSGIWGNITEGFNTAVAKGSGTGNVDANNI